MNQDDVRQPPFDTKELREQLAKFLNTLFHKKPVGDYKYGVYAFYDYDQEPIYVGQTNEKLRTRIRRHLTNQRTDAVAMAVLDPFEAYEIEVWPLVGFDGVTKIGDPDRHSAACDRLNALELTVYRRAIRDSHFGAVLNEKEPFDTAELEEVPASLRGRIVSDEVFRIRSHPDVRIARRALTLSRLAQVISERQVKPGLRKTLMIQAKRLAWLASRRYEHAGPNDDDVIEEKGSGYE